MKRSQIVYIKGAVPKGKPGWPDLAFSTWSAAKKRRVLTQAWSIVCIENNLQYCTIIPYYYNTIGTTVQRFCRSFVTKISVCSRKIQPAVRQAV